MKVIALIDGEHYPPVTRWGTEEAGRRGPEVVSALLVGGTEKLAGDGALVDLGGSDGDPRRDLEGKPARRRPEAILIHPAEPVLGYGLRMDLIAVALVHGIPYLGADFRFDPPISAPPLPVPTLGVIGTGK